MGIFTVLTPLEFLIRLALGALAVYRLAHAFSLETGPAGLFTNIREAVIKKYNWESWQAEFTRCPLCQSFWLSALAVLVFMPWVSLVDFVLAWFSTAALVMWLHLTLYRV